MKGLFCCYGCGAELQCDLEGAAGFLDPEKYELKARHRQLRKQLCTRCTQMSGGAILPAVVEGRLRGAGEAGVTTPEELRGELLHLRQRKVLVVLLVDLTDVAGSFLARVRDMIGGNPVILLGTKTDLLPKGTSVDEACQWFGDLLSPKINMISAHLLSARTGDGLADAARSVIAQRKGRDIYILGAANTGKSLFIRKFLETALGIQPKRLPISCSTPGTTLRTIAIDCFEGGSKLYDTPGVHLQHRMSAQLLPDELKTLMPRGRMKPYTLSPPPLPGSTVFWGGLVRLDVLEAPPTLTLTFCGFNLNVAELPPGADAAAEYAAQAGLTLTPPLTRESALDLGDLQLRRSVELHLEPLQQSADICVSGLGWISVGALPILRQKSRDGVLMTAKFDVWVPRGVEVSLRSPMPIGGLPSQAMAQGTR